LWKLSEGCAVTPPVDASRGHTSVATREGHCQPEASR
jgi:hypothetical protein